MKILLVLLVAIYSTHALLSSAVISEQWEKFKHANGRRFRSAKEEVYRKYLFQKKLENIEDHNERYRKGLETYKMGVNQFTDMTENEVAAHLNGLQVPLFREAFDSNYTFNHSPSLFRAAALPASFDWRSRGVVTPVKNQGGCGSCWAFATNGALEAHYKIRTGVTVSLSEQQLVDCVTRAYGCNGGWMPNAYKYIANNGGINYDEDYQYEAKDDTCRYQSSKPHVAIRGYAYLKRPSESGTQDMVVTKGPVSAALDATGLSSYSGGVYYNPFCTTYKVTHAVVIVGYGSQNGEDYWLVKNSWGADWGEAGYFKIARNRGNHCGIASYPSYPVF